MSSQTYEMLNKAWKTTTKVLFGEELGDMKEYEDWLVRYVLTPRKETSSISGKDVYVGIEEYRKDVKFVGFDELDFNKKFEPLNINEIKDIDSVVESLQERFLYTGNVVLGNSRFVEKSANITDSSYMYDSTQMSDSKYVAHTCVGRYGEYIFGSNGVGETKHCISGYETYQCNRCFEMWNCRNCSDVYYIYNCDGCQELLFSFNLYGKNYVIGNLQLDKDKYLSLKKKLLGEIRDELKRKKEIKSIIEIVNNAKIDKELHSSLRKELMARRWEKKEENKDEIEKFFTQVTSVVLGRPLYGIDNYADWLSRNIWKHHVSKSAFTDRKIIVQDYCNLNYVPPARLMLKEEWEAVKDRIGLSTNEVENLNMENAEDLIGKIAYMPFDYSINNRNMIYATTSVNSLNCYHSFPAINSKNVAVNSWTRNSENILGSCAIFDSSFCIDCNYSTKLNRCFEIDSSKYCGDLYFCHNCENVHDSMFCFNTKNLRNSIGNSPLPPEKYKNLKKDLLEQITEEIEQNKEFRWNIYNVGVKP